MMASQNTIPSINNRGHVNYVPVHLPPCAGERNIDMVRIPENVIAQLEGLSCEDVAEKLGMDVKRHRTLCFMHDDHHPSLAFMGEGDRKSVV